MTLEKLLLELDYPPVIKKAVSDKIQTNIKQIYDIASTAYTGENFQFALCNRMPLTRLAVITFILLQKYDDYKSLDIDDTIIFDTFRDVSLRAKLYYHRTGKIGITKEDVIWFRHIINTVIFKIGTLQYQPFKMLYLDEETIGEPYMSFTPEQKEKLPAGTPVINCHVPYGADLNPEVVEQSFNDAVRFIRKYFPDIQYTAFLCYSWLLYPAMITILGSNSNIKQFAKRFDVIGFCDDPEQAIENLFENGKKILQPNSSFLQRVAVDNIKMFGFACGIIQI